MKRVITLSSIIVLVLLSKLNAQNSTILKPGSFQHYIEYFNSIDDEPIVNTINNEQCWAWMQENIPWFECPDSNMEKIYYYRWWVYRKHIKRTPNGFVITEFLPEVGHAKKYNTIACAAGLHVDEGKWLRNKQYVSDYLSHWFSDEGEPRHYSSWFATSIYEFCTNIGDFHLSEQLLPQLVSNYKGWEESNLHASGLFWSYDDRDGGEHSISGSGLRPTLNSFMYADALSISKIAKRLGEDEISEAFYAKAQDLKKLVQTKIWDSNDKFFCTLPLEKRDHKLATDEHSMVSPDRHVRELYGYFPWRFNLPDEGFETAWNQLLDKEGFYAPYGPTTAEQRHPLFMKNRIKRCQWDGSSWPFATSLSLGGLRNLLQNYQQELITKEGFFHLMQIYTRSQFRTLPYGESIPWIGESLHPYSGIWLSRAIVLDMAIPAVAKNYWRDKNAAVLRGKDYNHSSYCDLIISGIVGLSINETGEISVNPLIPRKEWDWFCLDGVEYQGKTISIVFDKTGKKYGVKPGFSIYIDGKLKVNSKKLKPLTVQL